MRTQGQGSRVEGQEPDRTRRQAKIAGKRVTAKRRLFQSAVAMVLACAATAWPSALRSQPLAAQAIDTPPSTHDPAVLVRPANQEWLDRAKSKIDKVRFTTEKLAARAGKSEELKGKSDSLRREIVEGFRTIHQIGQLGDELLLRGERDGELIRQRGQSLKAPLDAAVAELRPSLGSPQGLMNAMIRRAKDQTIPVKQLDDLIRQKKWNLARDRLEDLLESADEVGRFVAPKEAEPLYKPLQERIPQVMPGYWMEKKAAILRSLRDEFLSLRPNLDSLRQKLIAAERRLKESKELRWDDQSVSGPDLLATLCEEWPKMELAVAQAAAVLHSIGTPAETDLKSLQVDYDATRSQAVMLVRELILGEPEALSLSLIDLRYTGYLDAIPHLMTALHATPENFQPATTSLHQLAARSPELTAKITRYREATDESLRWRRRLAKRYLKKMREGKPEAEPLAKLLDHPPALPGQEGPGGLKRVNQMFWSAEQSPEVVASVWTEQWKDVAITAPTPNVRWPSGANPQFVSPWHRRAVAELELPRQAMTGLTQTLAKDLLVDEKHLPRTLETALALHTATFGPFLELGGTIVSGSLDNLPDRLSDVHDPLDMQGALASGSLIAYPSLAALVRLQLKPSWIAHELFVWSSAPPPPPSSPTPPPAEKTAPVAAQPAAGEPKRETPAAAPAAAPAVKSAASTAAPSAAATGNAAPQPGSPAKKGEPAKSAPPVPKGGVPF